MGPGKGAVFAAFLKDIEDFIATNKGTAGFEKEFANLDKALASYREIQTVMARYKEAGLAGMFPTFARRILTATAQMYGGYLLMDQVLIAKKHADELGSDTSNTNSKRQGTICQILPEQCCSQRLGCSGIGEERRHFVIDADPEILIINIAFEVPRRVPSWARATRRAPP